jgi:hypothetical protein
MKHMAAFGKFAESLFDAPQPMLNSHLDLGLAVVLSG